MHVPAINSIKAQASFVPWRVLPGSRGEGVLPLPKLFRQRIAGPCTDKPTSDGSRD